MILLDTNVVSAFVREPPPPVLVRWADAQPRGSLHTTSVTAFDLLDGARRLPEGRRRQRLEATLIELLDGDLLGGRVLPLDRAAADAAAHLSTRRIREGRPVGIADTLIAGVALSRRFGIATRNLRHFADLGAGVAVVDPFAA